MIDHQSIALFFNCYDFMTPKEKKVAETLSDFWLAKTTSSKKNYKIYPAIATLAKKSGCSDRTVNRFLKKYDFLFSKIKGRYLWKGKISDPKYEIERQGRFLANEYNLDGGFFEIVAFLKCKKITKNWKKVRLSIVNNVNQNQELTLFIMGFEKWVMNIKMSHGLSEKCRTTSCIPFSSKKNLDKRISGTERSSDQSSGKKILLNPLLDFIEVPNLNESALSHAARHASMDVIRRVNNSYRYKKDRAQPIYNPSAWFIKAVQSEMVFSARLICK